jgi:hypothetical protein
LKQAGKKVQPLPPKILLKADDLAYERKRYIQDNSPYCIYLPSKEIMFKLMRACIKCEEISELWINNLVIPKKAVGKKW